MSCIHQLKISENHIVDRCIWRSQDRMKPAQTSQVSHGWLWFGISKVCRRILPYIAYIQVFLGFNSPSPTSRPFLSSTSHLSFPDGIFDFQGLFRPKGAEGISVRCLLHSCQMVAVIEVQPGHHGPRTIKDLHAESAEFGDRFIDLLVISALPEHRQIPMFASSLPSNLAKKSSVRYPLVI